MTTLEPMFCFLTLKKLNEKLYELSNLFPTNYHFFKHLSNFLQKNVFKNKATAESVFDELRSSEDYT